MIYNVYYASIERIRFVYYSHSVPKINMPFADLYYTRGLRVYIVNILYSYYTVKKNFFSIKISNENNNIKREQNQLYFYFLFVIIKCCIDILFDE